MKLFQRMGRIISANVNDVVDKFEDPDVLLDHSIREMEATIATAMNGAAKAIAGEKLLRKQVAEHEAQIEVWQRRAHAAVKAGDDPAARKALTRKREHVTLAAALQDQLAAAESAAAKLRRQIEAMQVRLAEAKRQRFVLRLRRQTAATSQHLTRRFGLGKIRDEAFDTFQRMSRKIDIAEAEAEALSELAGTFEESRFDSPPDEAIEQELAALKQSLPTKMLS